MANWGDVTVSLREHLQALSLADQRALQIKEKADRDALELDRQIRAYKDEKANELREQLSSERGNYASKEDLAAAVGKVEAQLGPVLAYVASQQGRSGGLTSGWGWIVGGVAVVGTLVTVAAMLLRGH
jgi:hypothetical protein